MAQVNYSDNGLVFITKQTFSSVTSVSFDNCFSADYSQYKIISDVTGSANSYALMKLRASGSTIANTYLWQLLSAGSTTVGGARNTNDNFALSYYRTNGSVISIAEILNPYQATYKTMQTAWAYDDVFGTGISLNLQSFGSNFTTQCDGFEAYPLAGTFTGTIYVYGYVES